MKDVQAGSVHLRVLDQGEGPPVVLVHGFPLDHSMWTAQIDRLKAKWRVIAPDLRGFGGSQVVPGTASMEQMADDLGNLLTALGVREPVVLCGLSMGGYVAFQFAQKYRARLKALVLCDTRAKADTPEAVAGRMKMIEQLMAEGPRTVAEAMLPKLFAPESFTRIPGTVDFIRQVILASPPDGLAAALRGMAERPDVTEQLKSLDVPTLVIVGEHDAISTPAEMSQIAAAIPGARLEVIAGAGHLSPLERPEAAGEAIEKFLNSLDK